MENTFEVQDRKKPNRPKGKRGCVIAIIIFLSVLALMIVIPLLLFYFRISYQSSDERKYGGHGFDYMHGYSSTDFTGYHVYDGEKLATLDYPADVTIEGVENMPILDGAEACYPLYAAVAKAIYKDIDKIEQDALELTSNEEYEEMRWEFGRDFLWDWEYSNGRVVSFTNTVDGYDRLIRGSVDLLFGARPSENMKQTAMNSHEQIESIPIGREAFVFFVEEDNPVDNLTSEQVRKIYSGEITNWNEVGGKNQDIVAFQRPEESGSQVMMKHFMGEVPLMEADTFTVVNAMGGVIEEVKQYNNERGAIGYTFQYFLTGLQQEKGVKMLSIDGIYPSVENIKNGSYPALVSLVCAKLKSNDNPNVNKVVDFLLSNQGQELVEKTGYGPLPRNDDGTPVSEPIIENEVEEGVLYELESEEHSGTLLLTDTAFELTYDGVLIKGGILSEPETVDIPDEEYQEEYQDGYEEVLNGDVVCMPNGCYSTKYGIVEVSFKEEPEDESLTVYYTLFDEYMVWTIDIGDYPQEESSEITEDTFLKQGDRFVRLG